VSDVDRELAAVAATRLINRELSWLDYNARVLELAEDADRPLLDRVRSCLYFSSNLDEFFMVRVAGLLDQVASGVAVRSPDGLTPQQALGAVTSRARALTDRQAELWASALQPALAEEGIVLGGVADCTPAELDELTERFDREIFPVLTPLGVGPGQPFPYISGLSLSLGVLVEDPKTGETRFARVKVPEGLPRFQAVGSRGLFVPLEEVIEHFLPRLFVGMEIVESAVFRVTRDADFAVSDEADDLLQAVTAELRRRRFGDVVRLEIEASASEEIRGVLVEGLRIGDQQVAPIRGLLDLADVGQLAALDRPDLKSEPWTGLTPRRFASARTPAALFTEIRRRDILVHHPYDSFATTFEMFVRAAARDPDVIAIKAMVYRTSGESPLIPALIEAAEQGKQSVCLVELKARFDEHRNIEWGRALEQAGVHVVYGFPNMKIHGKTVLVVRREGDGLRRYLHVGTGNYHAATARAYEDVGLFTADPEITADIADLYNYLTGFGRPQAFERALVAPFVLKPRLVDEIRRVAAAARAGEHARIRLKVNNLTDPEVINELYAASQSGVPVEIAVRSSCALRPGVPGLSESIRVRSVLGEFLEHSRILVLEAGTEMLTVIGSADMMTRNLDNRIEVMAPVLDPRAEQELHAVLDIVFADNTTAWELGPDGSWQRLQPAAGERRRPTQTMLRRRARRRAGSRSTAAQSVD
jgi:polyphosphate kinase